MVINAGRIVLGGLIAGVIRLVGGGIARSLLILPLFGEEIQRNHPSLITTMGTTSARIGFIVINLLMGITMVYVYTAMRPRFATRLATVASTALSVWFIASLNWGITALMGLFSWRHVIIEVLVTLGTVLVATYVGSIVYPKTVEERSMKASRLSPTASALG